MTTYLWASLISQILGALGVFVGLMANQCPKTVTKTIRGAVVELVLQLFAIIWCAGILGGVFK